MLVLVLVSRQYFHCLGSHLGVEGYCLSLGVGLDSHTLGLGLARSRHPTTDKTGDDLFWVLCSASIA